MRHLVHEVFFYIQDYVRVWYDFKVVWKQCCLAVSQKDKTRPLLWMLHVTVKTFSIQNQGQQCVPLNSEKSDYCWLGFRFLKSWKHSSRWLLCVCLRACMWVSESVRSLKQYSEVSQYEGYISCTESQVNQISTIKNSQLSQLQSECYQANVNLELPLQVWQTMSLHLFQLAHQKHLIKQELHWSIILSVPSGSGTHHLSTWLHILLFSESLQH